MNQIEQLLQHASNIEAKLGYVFKNRSLLALAFVHCSFVNENRGVTEHNERLEFLGDSVLGMLVSDYLYCHFPYTSEGQLSYLRSRLVEASSCVNYIQALDISSYLLLGRGERMNDGRGRETILADLFEAIIGAIFLDGGIEAARNFLFNKFSKQIESTLETPLHNWKALLQDYCQKNYQQTPIYQVLQESGPDHSKMFKISVCVNQKELGQGIGASKKEAQQAAAADALARFIPPAL
ncbi:MAG: ribonuclease III [Candidatus Protochlamydia sp.]|nr:ribonuclease III [Candidatus Protochlamydia sp.]